MLDKASPSETWGRQGQTRNMKEEKTARLKYHHSYHTRRWETVVIAFVGLVFFTIGAFVCSQGIWVGGVIFALIGGLACGSSIKSYVYPRTWSLSVSSDEVCWTTPEENRAIPFQNIAEVIVNTNCDSGTWIHIKEQSGGGEHKVHRNCTEDDVQPFLAALYSEAPSLRIRTIGTKAEVANKAIHAIGGAAPQHDD